MRRVRAAGAPWIGSLILHGALVAAAMHCRSRAPSGADPGEALEIISLDSPVDEALDRGDDPGGGGAGDREVAAGDGVTDGAVESAIDTASPRAAPERRQPARSAPPDVAAISSATRVASRAPGTAPRSAGDGGRRGGIGSGIGGGIGGGIGSGIGRGRGAGAGPAPALRAPRPAPRSQARPPRLVYPRRERDERPGEVFIVDLTVNEKGYVVGVRLKQGVSRDRDEKALEAVWRFHYEPALDRAGRPVKAHVVQRFMVE